MTKGSRNWRSGCRGKIKKTFYLGGFLLVKIRIGPETRAAYLGTPFHAYPWPVLLYDLVDEVSPIVVSVTGRTSRSRHPVSTASILQPVIFHTGWSVHFGASTRTSWSLPAAVVALSHRR